MLPGRVASGLPGGGGNKGLCNFNSANEAFALTAGDGRIRCYDTGSGELRQQIGGGESSSAGASSSGGHLTANYCAMIWGAAPAKASKSKKKVKGPGGEILVLGGANGDVTAWDVALGELKWRASSCHDGAVSSLAFVNGTIYSAGSDAQICEIAPGTGEVQEKWKVGKHALSSIAVSPDGSKLLAGSAALTLWDTSSHERVTKLTGHTVPAQAMAFSPDGKQAVSCAPSERSVAVWQLEASDSVKARKGALVVLPTEQPIVQVSTCRLEDDDSAYNVLAISETGVAYVWTLTGSSKAPAPRKFSVTSSKSSVECVLGGVLDAKGGLVVVRGLTARPVFERVLVGDEGSSVELNPSDRGTLAPDMEGPGSTGKKVKAAKMEVTVLGADAAGDEELLRPTLPSTNGGVGSSKKKRGAAALEEDSLVAGMVVDGETDGELSLGERLAALGMGEERAASRGGEGTAEGGGAVPRADSLSVLLSQAVRSGDKVLLERCLSVSDDTVISNTLNRMQSHDALVFLEQLVARLQSKPSRGIQLTRWLKAVMFNHAAYLMSAPGARQTMSSLYQIMDARVEMHKPLVSLAGRLDLLLAAQQSNQRRGSNTAGSGPVSGPLMDYVEPESERDAGVVTEDPFAYKDEEEDEENEWETDDEDDSEDEDEDESDEDEDDEDDED